MVEATPRIAWFNFVCNTFSWVSLILSLLILELLKSSLKIAETLLKSFYLTFDKIRKFSNLGDISNKCFSCFQLIHGGQSFYLWFAFIFHCRSFLRQWLSSTTYCRKLFSDCMIHRDQKILNMVKTSLCKVCIFESTGIEINERITGGYFNI